MNLLCNLHASETVILIFNTTRKEWKSGILNEIRFLYWLEKVNYFNI